MTVDQLIKLLELKPHPEGGFYRESYRSDDSIRSDALPLGYGGPRVLSTAIYYLLVPNAVSRIHRLRSDELFHFYLGDPVTWVQFHENTSIERTVMGSDPKSGHVFQMAVTKGTWFGGYLNEGGKFGLMGTTVSPGFEFNDLDFAERAALLKKFSSARADILKLTRE